jgi:hypothetical protein
VSRHPNTMRDLSRSITYPSSRGGPLQTLQILKFTVIRAIAYNGVGILKRNLQYIRYLFRRSSVGIHGSEIFRKIISGGRELSGSTDSALAKPK